MSFDNSRYIFDPFKNYSGVVMPQGRVQVDADWNEWLAEIARRVQAGTLDTMGRAVYPMTTPDAFYISATSSPNAVNIGLGRMYVDGLLAENHGKPDSAKWDPALAELSGTPQPAPASISGSPAIAYTDQPFPTGIALPGAAGSYLFYLDVWTRAVNWLQDPNIVDPAIGIDTSGRLQTVWQVRYMTAAAAAGGGSNPAVTCGTPDANMAYPARSFGLLSNGTVPNTSSGPCCLGTGTNYTGLENQFYRVQVHTGGPIGTATFKWSRENASVQTAVTTISTLANAKNNNVSVLSVTSLGPDQVLNFKNGDWIELLNDTVELTGQPDPNGNSYGTPGVLCQIDYVDPTDNSVYLTTKLSSIVFKDGAQDATTHIIRWNQSGTIYKLDGTGKQVAYTTLSSDGDIKIPALGTTLVLENGVTVEFSLDSAGSTFLAGDYWTFAARTIDGNLYPTFANQPPRGIHHHYTKLSVVTFGSSGSSANAPDCRTPWGPSGEGDCGCCTVTVGDNVESFGKYSSIQQAINNLPKSGGEVCILPGHYYESIIIDGVSEVTLRGSGPQTVIYAASAKPGGVSDSSGSTATIGTNSGISAILTITNSTHITLESFTMEAPDGMACILLDEMVTMAAVREMFQSATPGGSNAQPAVASVDENIPANARQAVYLGDAPKYKLPSQYIPKYGFGGGYTTPFFLPSGTDVTITGLVLTASTNPTIVAVQSTLLNISENRLLMKDSASMWPALYVSGTNITIEKNWIGLQDNPVAANYATANMVSDLGANFNTTGSMPVANGGIQIGGYSTTVCVRDNDIEGGAYNGISLGGFVFLDANASPQTTGLNGLFPSNPTTSTGTTLLLPAVVGNSPVAADGPLQDIRIENNRIANTGLCGVGPVGYFSPGSTPEIISISDLCLQDNTFFNTLQSPITPFPLQVTGLGYGAICLPDLQGAVIRDNVINNFGYQPGADVCGIFVLNGEQLDISRNQVIETRDWSAVPSGAATALGAGMAGIAIAMVSPPALDPSTSSAWSGSSTQGVNSPGSAPVYQPGLPALRLEENTVRVPVGCSLGVVGYGPFHITGNHFGSGGTVPVSAGTLVLNVLILNLGTAIELAPSTSFSSLYSNNVPPSISTVDQALSNSTSGAVLFSNNICEAEMRGSGATGVVSVLVMSLDALNFTNNHVWLDGAGSAQGQANALMDALLIAGSVRVSGNRFQEALGSVLFSGYTYGRLNITTDNISTYCLFSKPQNTGYGVNANNVSLVPLKYCMYIDEALLGRATDGAGGTPASAQDAAQYPFGKGTAVADPADKMTSAIQYGDTLSAARLDTLSQTHQARIAQINRTANIISAQAGTSAAASTVATQTLTLSKTTVARVELMKLQITAAVPTVPSAGWAIYGHVYNSSQTSVSGYSVYFVDGTNTYQNAYGIAYTQSDGSYQIVYPGAPAGQTAATPTLYLQIGNTSGDPVYSSKSAFAPVQGVATYQDLTLPTGEPVLGKLPIVLKNIILPVTLKESLTVTPAENAAVTTETSTNLPSDNPKTNQG